MSYPSATGRNIWVRGLTGRLLGGWQISGIMEYAGGNPLGATNDYNPLLVNGFDRPDIVPDAKLETFNYSRSKDFSGQNGDPASTNPHQCLRKHWALGTRQFGTCLCGLANSATEGREFRRPEVL